MGKNKSRLVLLTMAAVLTALTCVMTLLVRIPSPTKGYLNLGDCFVLLGGWLLGPLYGALAGGIGSALADLFAGYPIYIPATLLMKGMMAWIIAVLPRLFGKKHLRAGWIVAAVLAEIFMVIGYYLFEAVMIGLGFIPALAGVWGNAVQGFSGAVSAYFLAEIISHTNIFEKNGMNGFVKKQGK